MHENDFPAAIGNNYVIEGENSLSNLGLICNQGATGNIYP